MYNTSFWQIIILILLSFLLFGDVTKIKKKLLYIYKNLFKQ